MTTMKHTPGPWTTKPGRFWICQIGNNADDPGIWSEAIPKDGSSFPFGDKAADARLIAAAPDLLEALQKLKWVSIDKDNMEFKCETTCFVLDEIRAAIAKATGET